jgi:hypothetical protein
MLVAVATLACGGDWSNNLPRGVALRPTVAPTDTTRHCPVVGGEYWVQRELTWNRLIQPALSDDQRRIGWSKVAIAGEPLDSLQLILTAADLRATAIVRRGQHYDCASGWIVPRGTIMRADLSEEDSIRSMNDPKHHDYSLAIAGDTTGSLIARVRILAWSQFDVWCGDGCKGIPLPWSIERRTRWEYLGSTQRLPLGVPDDDIGRKVAAEERALELGEQAVRPIGIERMVKAMMPTGSEILAVTPDGAGYRLSVIVPKDTDMPDFIGRLINTQGLGGAHEVPLYGAWTMEPPRRWRTVIWVPRAN